MPPVFPTTRLRRTRQNQWIRRLVSETTLKVDDLIWPVFVVEGKGQCQPVPSMPGVYRWSIDTLVEQATKARDLGIPAIAIFPNIEEGKKTEKAQEATNPDNLVCRSIEKLKKNLPDLGVMTDVALDPYTPHGHDGILIDGHIDNDTTLSVLRAQALNQAKAGCDILGPSDMMDGRVGVIRDALEGKGFKNTLIMSYAAKYASGFYGPFRDAVGSKNQLAGDKKTYQQDPANTDEALREIQMDIQEGADMVMVKPGLPYLDVIHRASQTFNIPVFAYQVSGEYAMICAAADNGWINRDQVMLESLLSIKRAGGRGILTYDALNLAEKKLITAA